MVNPKDFVLLDKLVEKINNGFVDGEWISLFNHGWLSASLFSDEELDEARNNIYDATDGEPIILVREAVGTHKKEVQLKEEVILKYDLRYVMHNNGDSEYVLIDENGDDIVFAKYSYQDDRFVAQLKFIKEFIATKNMNLVIQYEQHVESDKSLKELKTSEVPEALHLDDKYSFSYELTEEPFSEHAEATIEGRNFLVHNDADIHQYWDYHDPRKEEFVISCDKNGKKIISTCDDNDLQDPFEWDGKSAYVGTSVYFKEDVLQRYYDDNMKYKVDEFFISGPRWSLPIERNEDEKLIRVNLGDLGCIPYKEQMYWRTFNVVPPIEASDM